MYVKEEIADKLFLHLYFKTLNSIQRAHPDTVRYMRDPRQHCQDQD